VVDTMVVFLSIQGNVIPQQIKMHIKLQADAHRNIYKKNIAVAVLSFLQNYFLTDKRKMSSAFNFDILMYYVLNCENAVQCP